MWISFSNRTEMFSIFSLTQILDNNTPSSLMLPLTAHPDIPSPPGLYRGGHGRQSRGEARRQHADQRVSMSLLNLNNM